MKFALKEKDCSLWVVQHKWEHIEGFHAWLWKGNKQVEVITHCENVEKAIVGFQ